MAKLLFSFILIVFSNVLYAETEYIDSSKNNPIIPPQAAADCLQSTMTNVGNQWWKTIYLTIQNACTTSVDFQNTTITFQNTKNLSTSFWGRFSPLTYPDNSLQITSQLQSSGIYLSALYLHFPTYQGSNSVLPVGSSITIIYGNESADYIPGTVNIYLGTSVNVGQIDLKNNSTQPANVSQPYAVVRLTFNGQPLSDVQVPWASTLSLKNLAAGNYGISPTSVTGSNGTVYQGTANPSTIALAANTTATSNISYAAVQTSGGIAFKVQALPSQISGYSQNPVVTLTNSSNGSSSTATTPWNATTTASNLISGVNYTFTTPAISFNGYNCAPTFTPSSAVAGATAPIVNLTYVCTQVNQSTVNVNVSGAPTSTSSVTATFTPNNGSTPVTKAITLSNGSGASTVNLTTGVVYTVSSTSVSGYSVSFNPQPLTANTGATEAIKYTQTAVTGGRIIGFMAGWKTPPSVSALVSAGYTHVMVSFGVFSTTNPGQIVNAFDTISASYIQQLKAAGIKVILSLGGASTDAAGTSVSFHDVLSRASSPDTFVATFVASMESFMTQYGFDGFDIDIEWGLNPSGTFTNPTGDIAVMARILNTMKSKHPNVLLTLTPQTSNVAVTNTFSGDWGNYASLIMQTYNSLEWVGIQLYNTGCMTGLDGVCYNPNATSSPNFSVAMGADISENWPAGYLPYIGNLKPSQVVLGYILPNNGGEGPVIPVSTIKRAVQCMRTAVKAANSCDTYAPPRAYPGFGGVFNWEISIDQANGWSWSTALAPCVKNGNCN